MRNDLRVHAAVHEAGHVVVALLYAAKVESATIAEDGKSGHTIANPGTESAMAVIAAAGRAAEQLVLGSVIPRASKGDELLALGLLASWDQATFLASAILQARRDAVRRIADALLDAGAIDGKRAAELLVDPIEAPTDEESQAIAEILAVEPGDVDFDTFQNTFGLRCLRAGRAMERDRWKDIER